MKASSIVRYLRELQVMLCVLPWMQGGRIAGLNDTLRDSGFNTAPRGSLKQRVDAHDNSRSTERLTPCSPDQEGGNNGSCAEHQRIDSDQPDKSQGSAARPDKCHDSEEDG